MYKYIYIYIHVCVLFCFVWTRFRPTIFIPSCSAHTMEHQKRSEHSWSELRRVKVTPGAQMTTCHQRCLGSTALVNNKPLKLYLAAPDNLLEKLSIPSNAMRLEHMHLYRHDSESQTTKKTY